jgi:hypothetical protein
MKRKFKESGEAKRVLVKKCEILHIPWAPALTTIRQNKNPISIYMIGFSLRDKCEKALKLYNGKEGVEEFMLEIVGSMHSYQAQGLHSEFMGLCKEHCIFHIKNSGILNSERSNPFYVFIKKEEQHEVVKYIFSCAGKILTQAFTRREFNIGIVLKNQNYKVNIVDIKAPWVLFVLRKAEAYRKLPLGVCKRIMQYL